MIHELELEIFKAGDYGEKGSYSTDDLEQIAQDYSPELHEAPVTLDHHQAGPAFGWVKALRRVGERLLARIKDLNPKLAELIREGAYKKRSIELYTQFTKTRKPYLRALSFLGAQIPEVKGLTDPVFTDSSPHVQFTFPAPDPSSDAEDELAPLTELVQELDKLRDEKQSLNTQLQQLTHQRQRSQLLQFCEELKHQGRFLPAWEEMGVVDFMHSLVQQPALGFGEDSLAPLDWFQRFLSSLPRLIPLEELASSTPTRESLEDLSLTPTTASINPDSIELHRRALSFQQTHPELTYAEALRQIAR